MRASEVRRTRFGTIIRPADETTEGRSRVEALDGFLIPMSDGLLLFDTGIGAGDPEVDAHYRPTRIPLPEALARAGARIDEVVAVANCHLHLDHAGGNPVLVGLPVFVQGTELTLARSGEHTIDGLTDFPGAHYEVLEGEAQIAPGVRLIPTPGHTAGHQSLLVETSEGGVLLAGQTHDTASGWTADVEAIRRADADVPPPPAWMPALLERVIEARFAHDAAIWRA